MSAWEALFFCGGDPKSNLIIYLGSNRARTHSQQPYHNSIDDDAIRRLGEIH